MEIAVIEQLITRVGLPVALCAVFIWIIIRVYLVIENKIIAYLENVSQILIKQANSVESISHAIESFATVLNTVCANTIAIDAKVDGLAAAAITEIIRVKTRENLTDDPKTV